MKIVLKGVSCAADDTARYAEQNPSLGTQVRLINETTENRTLQLWDFAAEFPSPGRWFYLRKSDLVIVMYDVIHPDFDYVLTEIELFQTECPGKPILIVGNKSDLLVSEEEKDQSLNLLSQFLEKIKLDHSSNFDYTLCTNKSFTNVNRVIQKAYQLLI